MKIVAHIAAGLLGLLFVASAVTVLFNLAPPPPMPKDSVPGMFFTVFSGGWLTTVKICELVGGILVAIPKTRNFGLLFLGPIVINILCFHLFAAKDGLNAVHIGITLVSAFLLWDGRRKFLDLMN